MKKRWSGGLVWISFLTIMTGILLLVGATYPKESRIVPVVIGLPTLILLLFLLLGEFFPGLTRWVDFSKTRQKRKKELGIPMGEGGSEFTEWRPILIMIGWVFAYFVFVFWFGFALVSPLYIAFFLIRKAQKGIVTAFAYGIVGTILIYATMSWLIRFDLWSGAIPSVIPGILGGSIIPPL